MAATSFTESDDPRAALRMTPEDLGARLQKKLKERGQSRRGLQQIIVRKGGDLSTSTMNNVFAHGRIPFNDLQVSIAEELTDDPRIVVATSLLLMTEPYPRLHMVVRSILEQAFGKDDVVPKVVIYLAGKDRRGILSAALHHIANQWKESVEDLHHSRGASSFAVTILMPIPDGLNPESMEKQLAEVFKDFDHFVARVFPF